MLKTIPSSQFKVIPWKNGLGKTTELAISKDGTLSDFDWRISMADVTEDGDFSDFSGYERNLILLSGNGMTLTFDKHQDISLKQTLDIANFNGGWPTRATLSDGPIVDFNLMTRQGSYTPQVSCYRDNQVVDLSGVGTYFVYSPSHPVRVRFNDTPCPLPAGHLLHCEGDERAILQLEGEQMIVIRLQSSSAA